MTVLRGWEWTKDFLSDELQLTHAMLHVHVGLALFVIFGLLLRRRPGSMVPLLLVFAAESVNEAFDFARYHLSHWPWKAAPTVHDVVDTMMWPVVSTLAARFAVPPASRDDAVAPPGPDNVLSEPRD